MRLVDLSPNVILTTDTGFIETSGILERYFEDVLKSVPLAPVYVVDGNVTTDRQSYAAREAVRLNDLDLGLTSATDHFLKGRVYMDHVQVPMSYARRTFEARVANLELMARETPWFLLDGNHRALACSLLKRDVPCRLLESDDDLREVRARFDAGEWPRLFAEGETLLDVVRAWESHVLSTASSRFGENEPRACAVSERRDWLYERKALPQSIMDYIEKSRQ